MRLAIVGKRHGWLERLKLRLMRAYARVEPPDVVKLLYHRPRFFGRAAYEFCQSLLRGPSEWTVGERELMAAFVSRLNQCLF